jgi:hypothetical protein
MHWLAKNPIVDFEAGIPNKSKAERLHDIELGVEKRKGYAFGAIIYYMYYQTNWYN